MKADVIIPKLLEQVNLQSIDTKYVSKTLKEAAIFQTEENQKEIAKLQEKLYAEGNQSLLIILQGMDTSGKDGSVIQIYTGCNPQGMYVHSFKKPTKEELAHDFLWRVTNVVPQKGFIGIFNRSQYEDVLIGKVEQLASKDEIERRYDAINQFEKELVEKNNTTILKFYLHISNEEQKERLEDRMKDPTKNWKFNVGDLPVRAKWPEYMQAYETALSRCSTEYAPWIIVPADRKWYRNLVLTQVIKNTLEEMNPKYPVRDFSNIKIV